MALSSNIIINIWKFCLLRRSLARGFLISVIIWAPVLIGMQQRTELTSVVYPIHGSLFRRYRYQPWLSRVLHRFLRLRILLCDISCIFCLLWPNIRRRSNESYIHLRMLRFLPITILMFILQDYFEYLNNFLFSSVEAAIESQIV